MKNPRDITYKTVDHLPRSFPSATLISGWGAWQKWNYNKSAIFIVKLAKMNCDYTELAQQMPTAAEILRSKDPRNGMASLSRYTLSDEICEPGIKAFFLIELANDYNDNVHWLTDDLTRFWPVSRVGGFYTMPKVNGGYYVVVNHPSQICFEEHAIVQAAIARYSEERE